VIFDGVQDQAATAPAFSLDFCPMALRGAIVPSAPPGYLPATSRPVGDRPMVGLQTLTLAI
jgi:hypothetical protein